MQEIENVKLKREHVQLSEENRGLHVQCRKLSEEGLYAKELASAAAVELKNLAAEVTKLSLQNSKLEKELQCSREIAHSRANSFNRKFSDGVKGGRRGRLSGRFNDVPGVPCDDFDTWNLDPNDIKIELQARKQREAALEAALAEKDFLEDEYRRKVEEAKNREEALENDLANMWVLVAKLKKDGGDVPKLNPDKKCNGVVNGIDLTSNEVDFKDVLREIQKSDVPKSAEEPTREESLVVRLKVCYTTHFPLLLCLLH